MDHRTSASSQGPAILAAAAAALRPAVPLSLEELRQIPIFAKLSDGFLTRNLANIARRDFEPGDVIVRAGDYSDAVYYIASGVVEVQLTSGAPPAGTPSAAQREPGLLNRIVAGLKGRPDTAPPTALPAAAADGTVILADVPMDLRPQQRVLLEAGEVFGEMSALSRYPVSADVKATTAATCIAIRTPTLRLMLKSKELAEFKRDLDERYRTRTLASHLRRVELFAELDDAAIARLRDNAELLTFDPGAVIVAQDAPADGFYLVRGGYVKVALRSGSGDVAVTYLRKGDHAGEAALLLEEPWPYSLTALEHVELVKIGRDVFRRTIAEYPHVQQALWDTVVRQLKQRGRALRNPLSSQYLQMAMDTGLIHGESVLLIDLTTCTRCDDCVQACADTHGGTPRFIREGVKLRDYVVPTACYQCTDPVCMIGCPTGAITRPLGTLEVTINKDTCIGCGNCVSKCPWKNITPVPYDSPTLGKHIDLATKCDLCLGRAAGPACVQMCPHGAAMRVNFKDLDKVSSILSRE